MDRQIVYAGQVPLETDILNTNQYAMLGLAKLAAAVFGTGSTMVNGFACTPTTPASMQINISGGEVYSLQSVDTSSYSSLPADTSHQIVKQGILWDTTTATIKAPTTVGQSINYLVQVAFVEIDSGAKVLQYYNSANPAQSFSGAGNSGAVQPTVRQNTCVINIKSGTAATTGSQVTPTPDAGYAGLWVIMVSTGQTTITSNNIVAYPNAPFINSGLLGLTPNFSVSPTAPTPPVGDKSNKVATMAALDAAMLNSISLNSPPAANLSMQGVSLGANYNNSVSLNFTPKTKGTVIVFGKLNLASVAASGSNVSATLFINGVQVSGDSTILSQSHFATAACQANVQTTITMVVTTGSTSPVVGATYGIAYIFVPTA